VFGFGSYVFLQGIEVCAFVNQTTLFVNQTKRFLNQKISELSKTMLWFDREKKGFQPECFSDHI
jgi:hypothetical protein